ncbi:MAG TPA: thioesterase domain-containing protein [Micromonosporaceae bacterium]|jgi:surfactin synthase thioesterase subunit
MSGALVNGTDRWFATLPARSEAVAVLLCLPYAGAGASAYHGWRRAYPTEIELQPLQLPGRENRISEPHRIDPDEVAEAAAGRIDGRYAIYGHSMGARLGFEVIRSLRRLGAPLPVRFYVGACRPPDETEPLVRLARLPEVEFVRRLRELGGSLAEALEVPELRDLVLPTLRADFAWIDSYRYRAEPPLPMPIVGFAGGADAAAPPDTMAGWRRHTVAGFRLRVLPGDHFFVHSRAAEVAATISEDLLRGDAS